MSTARVSSSPAAASPVAQPKPHTLLIGRAGVGKRSLLAASDSTAFQLSIHDTIPAELSGGVCLFALDATASAAEEETALAEIAGALHVLRDRLGGECAVAGLPVFVVLTKADLLARPGDSHAVWLERIEERKQQLGERLKLHLRPGVGFGALDVHTWATAVRRPVLADRTDGAEEPFGVCELFHQAAKLARAYRHHTLLQRRRTGALLGVLLVILLVMIGVIGLWGRSTSAQRDSTTNKARDGAGSRAAQIADARALLKKARELLGLARHSSAAGEVDWATWSADALSAAVRLSTAGETADEPLAAELAHTANQLSGLAARVRVLGLTPELPGVSALVLPAAEASPADAAAAAKASLSALRSLPEQTLPNEMPRGVANHLNSVTWSARERFLEPVRAEIRRRVLDGGNGKETPDGWRLLRDGWLAKEAPGQLADWRLVVMDLERLAGVETPTDPLIELDAFLRQDQFVLPLGEASLTLSRESFPAAQLKTQPDILTLRHRTPGGKELAYHLRFARADSAGVYRLDDGKSGTELLVFRPGDELHARLLLPDGKGKSSVLVWSAADSRSAVYAFDALNQQPRVQAETETDPLRGEIAAGVRLRFAQPAAWKLPDLFWK